jgi:molybdopterin/thiamine biosynthesis adenylyltransferase
MFGQDIGQPKAIAVAHNLAPHLIAGGTITAMALSFEEALDEYAVAADLVIVGVDNNRCRWAAATFARRHHIPAVFSMLSLDGSRIHTFLQGPADTDPCLWCALPNLDPEASAPCALGIITSCLVAAAQVTFFAHRALMGWPEDIGPYNWRASDLMGTEPEITGAISQQAGCCLCVIGW